MPRCLVAWHVEDLSCSLLVDFQDAAITSSVPLALLASMLAFLLEPFLIVELHAIYL